MTEITKNIIQDSEEDKLINTKQVRELVSISASTLRRIVQTGSFPQPVLLESGARKLLFHKAEVLEWMRTRPRVEPPKL
jgi:predicted DNA-binding transcriptional regulator AlpA